MQLILLGSGSSAGTPVIGCDCKTCVSNDPRNQRTRCSAAIRLDSGHTLLIDTGPDLRLQALRERLQRVDAVLYTHVHADHLHGIDDLRAFCHRSQRQIPLYGAAEHMDVIKARFAYTLRDPGLSWEMPVLATHVLSGPTEICGVQVEPIPARHGRSAVYGYRIGNLAYLTDVSEIPENSLDRLHGLEYLLLDCLRYQPHHTHINLEQSLAYAQRIDAQTTYLIHMTHELEYGELSRQLPAKVHAGYDGLCLQLASIV